jgi:uncharacterized coiled-coil protein SlyX
MELLLIVAIAALIFFVVQSARHQKARAALLVERGYQLERIKQLDELTAAQKREIQALLNEARVAAQRYVDQSNRLKALHADFGERDRSFR